MSKWVRRERVDLDSIVEIITGSSRTPILAIPLWVGSVLILNNLASVVGMQGSLVAVILGVICVVWWRWQTQRSRRRKIAITIKEEFKPPGKPGLILPLSTVAVIGGTPQQRAALPDALARLAGDVPARPTHDDFRLLETTNLESPLRAIEFHYDERHGSERLRDCWLITTEDVTYPNGHTERGSRKAAYILENWFFALHPEAKDSVHFHRDTYEDAQLCVGPRDYVSLAETVDAIFENAPYKPEHIIIDITPGTKPMTLALAFACFGSKRTMQYMTAGRHPLTGEVLGAGLRVPILLDDEAYLYKLRPAHERASLAEIMKGRVDATGHSTE